MFSTEQCEHLDVVSDKIDDACSRSGSGHSSNQSEDLERQDTITESEQALDPSKGPSVIAGGTAEGWTPVSAVVLWKRMIGILGNVNKIKDQQIHAKVFEHLIDVWNMLLTVFFLRILLSFCTKKLHKNGYFKVGLLMAFASLYDLNCGPSHPYQLCFSWVVQITFFINILC